MPAGAAQSLRHFIFRSQVLGLFRQYVRASRSLGAPPARSDLVAERALAAARAAGFRESGLTLGAGGRRVMVGVRCSLRMEAPVADGGAVLVPDSYIRYLAVLANEKYGENMERIARFEAELLAALGGGAEAAGVAAKGAGAQGAAGGGGGGGALAAGTRGVEEEARGEAPLSATPARRRRGGELAAAVAYGGAEAGAAALLALKRRQARVLGRIRALELRVGGAAAAATPAVMAAAGVVAAAAVPSLSAAAAGVSAVAAAFVAAAASPAATGPLLRWRPVPVSPDRPTVSDAVPRWGAASAVLGRRIVLVGGYGGGGAHARRADVLLYDTPSRTWEALAPADPAAPAPPARMGHGAAALGGGHVVVVGGRTSPVDPLGDVWILDLGARAWIRVHADVDPVDTAGGRVAHAVFPGRYRHSVVSVPPSSAAGLVESGGGGGAGRGGAARATSLDGWRVVVFGGRNADAVLGDAWVLYRDPGVGGGSGGGGGDVASGWRWRQVAPSGATPSPRKSHAACFMPGAAHSPDPARPNGPTIRDDRPPPPSSVAAVAAPAAAAAGRMYVHGGTCGYGMHFCDTSYLDLASYTWHRLAGQLAPGPGRAGDGGAGGGGGGGAPACFSHTLS
ncbi:tRNA wybutosine-synthesizing protein 2/3/4, partial [Tetrabaena socialis]